MDHPKLDTRISVLRRLSVRLRVPPLDSETGWTGELWSNPVLLILEKYRPATTTPAAATPVSRSGYPPWILKRAGLESSGRIASS